MTTINNHIDLRRAIEQLEHEVTAKKAVLQHHLAAWQELPAAQETSEEGITLTASAFDPDKRPSVPFAAKTIIGLLLQKLFNAAETTVERKANAYIDRVAEKIKARLQQKQHAALMLHGTTHYMNTSLQEGEES